MAAGDGPGGFGVPVGPPNALDPTTTKGDILVRGNRRKLVRLGVGTDTQVLTADSTQASGIKWAAGGGGGVTVQYPALKPATPTDDFNAATLNARWSAHSLAGTWTTADLITQGEDWIGSSVDMSFSGQGGSLYTTHANGDLDFTVGGMRTRGPLLVANAYMIGIFAVDTTGAGVGVAAYTDGGIYSAGIGSWVYTGNNDSWLNYGLATTDSGRINNGDYWFRLKRVSGTWTGYASRTGRVWDKTFATRADAVTVAYVGFGIVYNSGFLYYGRVIADYYQLDV